MNLNQQIKQLECVTLSLPKEHHSELLREIWQAKEELNEGRFHEMDEILSTVGRRINYLIEQ